MMPGMDGISTLSALQASASLARIPVVFMTGYAKELLPDQDLNLSSSTLLIKPFTPRVLASTIRTVLDHASQGRRQQQGA